MSTISKKTLIQQIRAFGIAPSDTLLIHSSMKAIGTVEGGIDGVLDVFSEYLKSGLLLFPTHTWKDWNCPGNVFDVQNEPSCVGILSETFRKRPGVIRSWHPTHSIAGLGLDAKEFLAGEEKTQTPCPRQGCWGRLYDRNAKILFLGAPIKTNTFLHSVEEWHNIPDRLAKDATNFKIVTPDNRQLTCSQFRHSSTFGDVSQNYGKLENLMLKEGISKNGCFGSAISTSIETRALADKVGQLLQKNPFLFCNGTSL